MLKDVQIECVMRMTPIAHVPIVKPKLLGRDNIEKRKTYLLKQLRNLFVIFAPKILLMRRGRQNPSRLADNWRIITDHENTAFLHFRHNTSQAFQKRRR